MAHVLQSGERTGPEGKPIANRLLLSLGDREFRTIRRALEFVSYDHHDILHESHQRAKNVYFPNDGLVSLVVVMEDGKTAEAGVVGNEGVVGLEGAFGIKRAPLREIVQIEGSAYRASALEINKALRKYPALLLRLSLFAVVNRMQISQTAACNRLHGVEKRLARWLLMTQDRVESGFIPLTHDFLAIMLGTDRGSVTSAAGILQRKEMIRWTRGSVHILNRKALEQFSCECYHLIREYNAELVQ